MYNVIVVQFRHETNTFLDKATTVENFKAVRYMLGDELGAGEVKNLASVRDELGGFLSVLLQRSDVNVVLPAAANATPGGVVEGGVFRAVESSILAAARKHGKIDGVLLGLHGAMVTEDTEDGEGSMLEALRQELGNDVPIFMTLDLHANVTEKMARLSTGIFLCKYYPHVDFYERGVEAAKTLMGTLDGSLHPVMKWKKLPLLLTTLPTSIDCMKKFVDLCDEYEKQDKIISVSIAHGFLCSDIYELGAAVVAVTDENPGLAESVANHIGQMMWEDRDKLARNLYNPGDAIDAALAGEGGPYVFSESADNPGGGSSSDGTAVLRALVERDVQNAVVVCICDPESASAAWKAGPGNYVELSLGGKHSPELLGEPLVCRAYVKVVSDGRYVNKGVMGRGFSSNMGLTAVVVIGGVEVLVTSKRVQPYDTQALYSIGIDPRDKKIIVLKSAVHFRAAYEGLAKEIIDLDAPGLEEQDPMKIEYRNRRKPLYPLDRDEF